MIVSSVVFYCSCPYSIDWYSFCVLWFYCFVLTNDVVLLDMCFVLFFFVYYMSINLLCIGVCMFRFVLLL